MAGQPRSEAWADNKRKQDAAITGPVITVPEPTYLVPVRQKVSLGVIGFPGGGKTYDSVVIACELRQLDNDPRPVLVIDVQHGQITSEARTMRKRYGHDAIVWLNWLAIDPTVHPRTMLRWLQENIHKFSAVVIDPFSRVWTGALVMKDSLVKAKWAGGDERAAWGPVTDPAEGVWTHWMDLVQLAPCHMIVTGRMKDKAEKQDGEWIALGGKPQWREETTFELNTGVLEAIVPGADRKHRYQLWRTRGDQPWAAFQPTEDIVKFAHELHEWLNLEGEEAAPYHNPAVSDLWVQLTEERRELAPEVRRRAGELLKLAGLLTEDGKVRKDPALSYTYDDLVNWQRITERAKNEAAGGTPEPDPQPAPAAAPVVADVEDDLGDDDTGPGVDPGERTHFAAAEAFLQNVASAAAPDPTDDGDPGPVDPEQPRPKPARAPVGARARTHYAVEDLESVLRT